MLIFELGTLNKILWEGLAKYIGIIDDRIQGQK